MVDDQEGGVEGAGETGEAAEKVAGALEAGLAATGGGGEGVDDDEGGADIVDHDGEHLGLPWLGEVDEAGTVGREH
jgi:hypothetical protein